MTDLLTDITDETQFVNILCNLSQQEPGTFTIRNGFIYAQNYHTPDIESDALLVYWPTDDMQKLYEIYLKTKSQPFGCGRIELTNSIFTQKRYLMFGGEFTFITNTYNIYEVGNLLFKQDGRTGCSIVQVKDKYYSIHPYIEKCFNIKTVEPIVTNYQFNKSNYWHYLNKSYILIDRIIHFIADQYDQEYSFPCKETGELINVMTNERVKTYRLQKIVEGRKNILKYLERDDLVVRSKGSELLFSPEWNTYHIYDQQNAYILPTI